MVCRSEWSFSCSGESEELLSSARVISEGTQHTAGGSFTARLAHSPHRHTHMSAEQTIISTSTLVAHIPYVHLKFLLATVFWCHEHCSLLL